jgi:hypothetical protein
MLKEEDQDCGARHLHRIRNVRMDAAPEISHTLGWFGSGGFDKAIEWVPRLL